MNKKIPTPISCDLYDHLEIWSMKKQTVLVRYAKEEEVKLMRVG